MSDDIEKLKKLCKQASLELTDCGFGHFQVKGKYLVNYYPLSKKQSAYIAGTIGAIEHVTPGWAVAMANGKNWHKLPAENDKRKSSYVKARRRLWNAGIRHCRWCKVAFTAFEETTLEHVIPLSKGGLDNPNNHDLAHKDCNNARGNLLPHKELRRTANC